MVRGFRGAVAARVLFRGGVGCVSSPAAVVAALENGNRVPGVDGHEKRTRGTLDANSNYGRNILLIVVQ